MSLVKIQGNASGTGIFTVAAPNSNTDRTLTLPDSTGTIATAESTLSQFNVSGSAPVYACRAWVNFNGTGTVAIRASGNVSSITDNGTGDYTVNFTTAMPDTNYAISTSASYMNGDNNSLLLHGPKNRATYTNAFATSGVRVQSSDQNQNAFDAGAYCVAIFR